MTWLVEISHEFYEEHGHRIFGPYEREGDAWHALQQAGWKVHIVGYGLGVDADPPEGAYPFDTADVFTPELMGPYPKGEPDVPITSGQPWRPVAVDELQGKAPDWALPWLASLLGIRR